MNDYQGFMQTPIGILRVGATEEGITCVEFVERVGEQQPNTWVNAALRQLDDYFAGKLKQFDLPLKAKGTEFRHKVWQALLAIPYGKTACYGDIANALDNPKAVRAVGSANGANPIAIVVPCHRIIGKDGTLTGYAGGLSRKQWLLQHESGALA